MRFATSRQFGLISMVAYLPLLMPGWTTAITHQEAAEPDRCAVSCATVADDEGASTAVVGENSCSQSPAEEHSLPEHCPCPTCPDSESEHCVCNACVKCLSAPPVLVGAFLPCFYEQPVGAAAPAEARVSRLFRPPQAT